jgi:hypothetical protein
LAIHHFLKFRRFFVFSFRWINSIYCVKTNRDLGRKFTVVGVLSFQVALSGPWRITEKVYFGFILELHRY